MRRALPPRRDARAAATAGNRRTSTKGTLPTGGNAVVMLTRDPARQAATWQFIQFTAGPGGQTIMVKGTSYVPRNTRTLNDDRYQDAVDREDPLVRTAIQ